MRYPIVQYRTVDDDTLELDMMDGTSRLLKFESAEAAAAALRPGRADIDAAAILVGAVPHGMIESLRTVARSAVDLLDETSDTGDSPGLPEDEPDRIRAAVAKSILSARR